MRLVSVTFDYRGKHDYARLMEVFRASCARHMPEVTFEEHRLSPPPYLKPGYSQGCNSNTHKLRHWVKVMEEARETVCFADCDMLALRTIACADALDFDLAYTVRTHARIPVNGGVVFVRPTPGGRAAVRRWLDLNDKMFTDHTLHEYWRRKYCGMNQAAFGCMLHLPGKSMRVEHATGSKGIEDWSAFIAGVARKYREPAADAPVARLMALSCEEWNACNDNWRHVPGAGTRLVHLKGDLRRALLSGLPTANVVPAQRYIVGQWREYGL